VVFICQNNQWAISLPRHKQSHSKTLAQKAIAYDIPCLQVDGNDPLESRKKAAKGETVKDLCAAYLEQHAKVHKKSWKEDDRRIERYILPIWGPEWR